MNDDMWQSVFLTRTCALAGGEQNAAEDAHEDDQAAFERWQESGDSDDLSHSIWVSHWFWTLHKHHLAVRNLERARRIWEAGG